MWNHTTGIIAMWIAVLYIVSFWIGYILLDKEVIKLPKLSLPDQLYAYAMTFALTIFMITSVVYLLTLIVFNAACFVDIKYEVVESVPMSSDYTAIYDSRRNSPNKALGKDGQQITILKVSPDKYYGADQGFYESLSVKAHGYKYNICIPGTDDIYLPGYWYKEYKNVYLMYKTDGMKELTNDKESTVQETTDTATQNTMSETQSSNTSNNVMDMAIQQYHQARHNLTHN